MQQRDPLPIWTSGGLAGVNVDSADILMHDIASGMQSFRRPILTRKWPIIMTCPWKRFRPCVQ